MNFTLAFQQFLGYSISLSWGWSPLISALSRADDSYREGDATVGSHPTILEPVAKRVFCCFHSG